MVLYRHEKTASRRFQTQERSYQLVDFRFRLRTPVHSVACDAHQLFAHLSVPDSRNSDTVIELVEDGNQWELLHVPAGSIPKDGPSAGVTMVTALVSALTNVPVRPKLAMTGEITLSGHVLPVGGIKEKVLAARRAKIEELILPAQNEKNVREDIQPELLREINIHYVKTIDEVLELAFPKRVLRAVPGKEPVQQVI